MSSTDAVDHSPHPVLAFLRATFSVTFWILAWTRTLVAFTTITVPHFVYRVLSYSLTLQLDFWTLAILFTLFTIGASFFIRYRYLNSYSTLREAPLSKPDSVELHPDIQADSRPQTFHNYLDEFLLAVRVFGFLEKPVFHELARHLQTRRLIAGDTLQLDQDKNFYCVVDGLVQVYSKSNQGSGSGEQDEPTSWDDDELNGYHLLNEVGSGGTLSSLFTILSLFTENVHLAWPDPEPELDLGLGMGMGLDMPVPDSVPVSTNSSASNSQSASAQVSVERPDHLGRSRANSEISQLDLSTDDVDAQQRTRDFVTRSSFSSGSISSQASTILAGGAPDQQQPRGRPSLNPLAGSGRSSVPVSEASARSSGNQRPPISRQPTRPAGLESIGGSIARASVDTTLAVIPAVILTRFSRVTFNVAHKYLGLTTELLRTEKAINDLARHPLPAEFYQGGGMQRLRQRFMPDFKEDQDDESALETRTNEDSAERDRERGYFGLSATVDSPAGSDTRGHGHGHGLDVKTPKPRLSTLSPPPVAPPESPVGLFRRRSQVNAGDLLSMTGSSPTTSFNTFPRNTTALFLPGTRGRASVHSSGTPPRSGFSGRSPPSPAWASTSTSAADAARKGRASDFDLKDGVMDCFAKSIGLIQPPISGLASPEASPSLTATDPSHGYSQSSYNNNNYNNNYGYPSFASSFSSLSLLQTAADDASSVTGASSVSMFGLRNDTIDNEVEILFFKSGDTLVHAGERNAGMFFVIEGFLDVSLPTDDDKNAKGKEHAEGSSVSGSTTSGLKRSNSAADHQHLHQNAKHAKSSKHLFTVKAGGIAGYFSSLSGIASYVDIRAKTDAYVGFLSHSALERLLEKRPIVLMTLAKRLISLLSPLVLQIDASLDWQQVEAGQVLWRPQEPSDSFYIVINGRLRDLVDKESGGVKIVGEYGQGDTVGELDVITSSARSTTLHAIRDTELVRMPVTLFNAISVRNPKSTIQLLRMIASRVRETAKEPDPVKDKGSNLNLKTVAIIPASKNVPVAEFAKKLQAALEDNGAPTSYLTQAAVTSHLGRHAFTKMGKLKVASWLADQEQRYRIVLYVADSVVSAQWTQTCIRQADSILVVGMGDDPAIGEYERLLLSTKTTARKELVILHPQRYVVPGSTRDWLKIRPWMHSHFHVEMPGLVIPKAVPIFEPPDPAAILAFKKLKTEVQTRIDKYRGHLEGPAPQRPAHSNDFARLARRLCGKSIGIVLGGGGARGISHLGVLRALEEHGIPIDQIGGTSIGAFVSGLYAREGDLLSSVGRAKQFSRRMGNVWRVLSDITYPIVAYTTGHEFNRSIYKAFYDTHIEDMWLPYFCNTTNILTSKNEIHSSGYAWRYIRASMTLAGLLPPLCDNGNVLVDGGYVDNLPVTTMVSMGASTVFAVDVGAVDDTTPRNFGDSVSGWWLLLNRLNPFAGTPNIPAITEIQSRLAYVSSVKTLEDAKVMEDCWYMPMPVQAYGTLQFGKFEEILALGYKEGTRMLDEWKAANNLPSGFEEGFEGPDEKKKKGRSLRRNSI